MADILIIGAGWYGCHLAKTLSEDLDVIICDNNGVFSGASGKNQNRLHLGFHYPRSHVTRRQSKDGFYRFIDRYSSLSEEIDCWYSIKTDDSLIDFDTYKSIMSSSGLDFTEEYLNIKLSGISGSLKCHEHLIKTDKARKYFESELSRLLIISDNTSITDAKMMIDCTGGRLSNNHKYIYELCVMLRYTGPSDHPSITIMDGPFFTIHPTEYDSIFTVYSVMYTPVSSHKSYDLAYGSMITLNKSDVDAIKNRIENQIVETYPGFKDSFVFEDAYTVIRNKSLNKSDRRCCEVTMCGNSIIVMPGKIDNIFYAEDQIRNFLKFRHIL
jgi:hypothetical protein